MFLSTYILTLQDEWLYQKMGKKKLKSLLLDNLAYFVIYV